VLVGRSDRLDLEATQPATVELDEGAWAAARWAWLKGEPTGKDTSTLPSAEWRFLPLQTVRGRLGVLGVRPQATLDEPVLQALDALADQAAVALERVRLVAESARAAALENTQRLRTALLASLGHDLRTPLAGIQGAASTLRSTWDALAPETRADLLETIEQDVGRMARFLANIADLTRLESGEVRPRLAPVLVAEIVDAALGRIPELWHVAVRVPEGARVSSDPALLEQTLFNVLDNAKKYAPDGSLVRIRCESKGGEMCLSVADEGLGIPPEEMGHVFDSFFRVQRGDRTAPGTGLGLAIARGLVEAMGGRITAVSPNPQASSEGFPGTVITICLPLAAGSQASGPGDER
jgi:two-component system sensor histidine kinase KdpD